MTAVQAVRDTLQEIEHQLEGRLAPMRELAQRAAAVIGATPPGTLAEKDLAHLLAWLTEALEGEPAYVSFGFAAAPGVMSGQDRYLLWLQRRATGIGRLRLNLAEDDPDLYDYFDMEWYAGALARRAPSIYGPYVDYAGAEFLVLTVAVPVEVEGRFVGVAGADLDPHVLERWLVPALRALPGDAVIVNADRSVLASGSARWMPGERLGVHPGDAPEEWLAVEPLAPWTGWTLALGAPESVLA